jgi:DNA polymerase/3'-5' exonuclease PolX
MYTGELSLPGGKFKALAYKKAIDNIRRFDGPVTSAEDIKKVDGVGKKIYDKIVEIVATGGLAAAERMKARTDVSAMDTLLGIHGVGPVKARELIAAGYTSIAELRAHPEVLNDTQRLGLKHYEAGIQRIPRAEMMAHEAMLLGALPGVLTGTIVGSYRRGAANSGDIDVLLSYNAPGSHFAVFRDYVAKLAERGYIVDKLVSGDKKWMGYVRLGIDGIPRRLDLLLTPPAEFAYAILYFTGSDKFNIAFRRHCLTRGYSLNEHTMKPVGTAPPPSPPPMTSEADIFAFVGLRYVPPTERVDGAQIVPVPTA